MNHAITFILIAGGFYLLLVGLDRVLRPIMGLKKIEAGESIKASDWNKLITKIESEMNLANYAEKHDGCEQPLGIFAQAGVDPVWHIGRGPRKPAFDHPADAFLQRNDLWQSAALR